MKRFSTIHTGLGTSTVSHCLVVGHASLLCPHCELFLTRFSSPRHGPIFLPQLSYGPENELGLRFSPSPLPSWGFPAFFWETDGQVNTWAVFQCFIYYLIADWQYPGQRDFTVQNGATVGGLSWSQQPGFLPSPCEAQGGLLLIYKRSVPLETSWLQWIDIITIIIKDNRRCRLVYLGGSGRFTRCQGRE